MLNQYLDPREAHRCAVLAPVPGILPKRTRNFGYFPSLDALKAGDLLLFEPLTARKNSRAVQIAQSEYFADDHRRWTHAAVYILDGLIIEALPSKGVVESHLSEYVPGYLIRARRCSVVNDAAGYRIALHAMKQRGRTYDLFGLLAIASSFLNISRLNQPVDRRYTICSQVFYDSFLEATRISLDECPPSGPVLPSHLSNTPSLSDVDLVWAIV